jgi:hypothetical protein
LFACVLLLPFSPRAHFLIGPWAIKAAGK